MTSAEARLLRGLRIVSVSLRPFKDGRGGKATDPIVYLSDGSSLLFVTQETENGDYGTELIWVNGRKSAVRRGKGETA